MTALLLAGLIFFLAGCIQGLTGFGGGLMAIPLLCLLMDVKEAVSLSILSGLAITGTLAYQFRRLMERRKILPLLLGSLPGVVAGTLLLKAADPLLITRSLGGLLIAISLFNLTFRPRPLNPSSFWGYVAGFLSGAITASVGAGGPPVIIYTTLTSWKKDEIKATLTGFFILNGSLTAVVHAANGMITRPLLTTYALVLPVILLGTHLGTRISGRLNRRAYLRLVYLVLALLGLMMLWH